MRKSTVLVEVLLGGEVVGIGSVEGAGWLIIGEVLLRGIGLDYGDVRNDWILVGAGQAVCLSDVGRAARNLLPGNFVGIGSVSDWIAGLVWN